MADYEYVESHPNGDGYFHECGLCRRTIGESSPMVFADGIPLHNSCFEDSI